MKKSKLISTFIFLVLIASLFFVSCNENKQRIIKEPIVKKTQLSFRITWTNYSGRGVAIQKIVDTYNEANKDGYEIVLESGDEDINSIGKLLEKRTSEPIYVLPYRYVKYFGEKGDLIDLTSAFQTKKDLFYPELWKLGEIKRRTYGIPWLGHSICLIYNKNLLKKAGVNVASINNLNSLLKAIEQIEKKTKAKGIGLVGANHNDVSWMVNQFVYGFGSSLVNKEGTKVMVNNKKAKAAIEFYKYALGKHAQPSWINDTGVEVMNHFRKQEIAFEFQGVWGVTDIQKNGNPFEVGLINLEDIGLYSEVGPMMLSIPKSMSKEKAQEALKFINFMISTEAQEKIMDGEYSPEHDAYYPFRVPVRKDISASLVFIQYPEYIPFLKGFKRPSIDVPVPKWQTIKDKYYAPGLHQVMKSELSVDGFLKRIELKGNEILVEK
jgi:multiple sugar transport system substrate-binding protein